MTMPEFVNKGVITMTTQKTLSYDDIQVMKNIALEYDEKGEGSVYGDLVQEYCVNALEYVDMMNSEGFEADFTFESLAGIFLAIVLFTADNGRTRDMDPEEALYRAKDRIAGYVLFFIYNNFVEVGYNVDLKVNDFETGLNLVITNDEGREAVYDVVDSLDRAFEFVNLSVMEAKMAISFEHEDFINNLLNLEGGNGYEL